MRVLSDGQCRPPGPAWAACKASLGARPRLEACRAVKQLHELRLGEDVPLTLKAVAVCGRELLLLSPCIDAVMEAYIACGQTDRDPYWAEPWPSAVALGEELLGRPELVAGRTVYELGCGLGLAGLAAALAGAAEVVLLDREPLALQLALLNAQLAGLAVGPAAAASPASPGSRAAPRVEGRALEAVLRHLPRPQASAVEALLAGRRQQQGAQPGAGGGAGGSSGGCVVRAEVFDWNEAVALPPADVLLACDVLYESFSVEPVARVVPALLRVGGGRLLLADPPDRARHNREYFLDMLCEGPGEAAEFVVEEAGQRRAAYEGRSYPVELLALRRCFMGRSDTVGVKVGQRA